ncbi:hypothetical protein EXIGLDRAFT_774035 [Exidia glandulosa HHB12029]|uniref:DUF6534 domain-containing protein n=1 Tax=Exidia glandulosa HHB12029 TaxID=1314781 RepID=A0A165EJ48_EXIGL|nr:hypothetical protein EXIGLDRAFT_774035 [Exidia glandulosa HHB12029]
MFLIHSVYIYTIKDFGNYATLTYFTWSLVASLAVSASILFAVQSFYCMRIWRLSSKWIAILCWTLASVRVLSDYILTGVLVAADDRFDVLRSKRGQALGLIVLCDGAASDLLIAGFTCWIFFRARATVGGIISTDRLLDKLIRYTIASGVLTGLIAVVQAVVYVTLDNFVFAALYCSTAKVFSNSLLASLNERRHLRRELEAPSDPLESRRQAVSGQIMFAPGPQITVSTVSILEQSFEMTPNLKQNTLAELTSDSSGRV